MKEPTWYFLQLKLQDLTTNPYIGRYAAMIYLIQFRCCNSLTKIQGTSLRAMGEKKVFTSYSQFLQAANSAVYPCVFALGWNRSNETGKASWRSMPLSRLRPCLAEPGSCVIFVQPTGEGARCLKAQVYTKTMLNKNNLLSLKKGSLWKDRLRCWH